MYGPAPGLCRPVLLTSDVLGTGFATVDDGLRAPWDGGWADIAVD